MIENQDVRNEKKFRGAQTTNRPTEEERHFYYVGIGLEGGNSDLTCEKELK